MRLWPSLHPRKCTADDVRFFLLLCQGQLPEHTADIDIHVGSSTFGFCKSLLGSGIFARSILVPLQHGKKSIHVSFSDADTAILQKGLKRHFKIKSTPVTWVSALQQASTSVRFLKAFSAAKTSFSAGWLQQKLSKISGPAFVFTAKIEYLAAGTVSGYAYNQADTSKQLMLDFFINDTFVGASKTGGVSREIHNASGADQNSQFSHTIRLPRHLSERDHLYLSIYEHATGTLLCPAVEFPTTDIRHSYELQHLTTRLESAKDKAGVADALERIEEALPNIKQFAALPLSDYSQYRATYPHPAPPQTSGMLPNIAIAKGPTYTYDPQADIVLFLDKGASLSKHAAHWIQHTAHATPDASVLFGDYCVTSEQDDNLQPHFRTAFDLDLFLQQPAEARAYAVRREHLEQVGGLIAGENNPHAALWLRLLECVGEQAFCHVPHAVWHLEPNKQSAPESMVREYFARTGSKANAYPHKDAYGGAVTSALKVEWPIDPALPKLAIIIPTRDALDLVRGCVESLRETLTHTSATEIIIVDNGSTDIDTKDWLKWVDHMDGIRVLLHDGPFNWADINNKAAAGSDADYFLFLNNDTLALDKGWDHILRRYLNRPDVGMVGARLLFEDGTLQFGGYITNSENIALKEAYGETPDIGGYRDRSQLTHQCTSLIGAFLACTKEVFMEAGGFDAKRFPIAFNDIDFCLTVGKLGYKNLYVPAITFNHLESKTRGYDAQDTEKSTRENKERQLMRDKWGDTLNADPWYPDVFLKREPTHSLLAAPEKASITSTQTTSTQG